MEEEDEEEDVKEEKQEDEAEEKEPEMTLAPANIIDSIRLQSLDARRPLYWQRLLHRFPKRIP